MIHSTLTKEPWKIPHTAQCQVMVTFFHCIKIMALTDLKMIMRRKQLGHEG